MTTATVTMTTMMMMMLLLLWPARWTVLLPRAAVAAAQRLDTHTTPALNLTAVTGDGRGESTLECWQLANPFIASTEGGLAGSLQLALGQLGNASYNVIPGRFDGGFHHAPAFQYVLFTTGLAHITLYKGTQEAWVQGGKYGLIIAADTADCTTHGHRTRYPGAADTVSLEIPFRDRRAFKYKVLHPGACFPAETFGI
ncbi:hypothetical protein AAL_03713 [Moelleriella libera RCEF 2490]|uniref:Small secreted protein n=1 Tax=Moelleriella libera RCEF 2490 TaxID=1081109 RepID=A0A168CE71_9HYPO|nr:hypothetical protein AAL_03713 [Moelleriella libera RCEF 2490]